VVLVVLVVVSPSTVTVSTRTVTCHGPARVLVLRVSTTNSAQWDSLASTTNFKLFLGTTRTPPPTHRDGDTGRPTYSESESES
jgi:hypothetical protein